MTKFMLVRIVGLPTAIAVDIREDGWAYLPKGVLPDLRWCFDNGIEHAWQQPGSIDSIDSKVRRIEQ